MLDFEIMTGVLLLRLSRARAFVAAGRTSGLAIGILATLAANASAQCETFGPLAAGFRSSQSAFYDQVWSQVARTNNGYVAVWSEGQDVVLRRYDANLAPSGNDTLVNATLNAEVQDEPAVAVATGGNQMIAWSERHGYDGELMGIYGRVYGPTGTPLASEFRLNQITAASQWRPLIAPTPAGGFVVAWSGNWDGDAYFRVFGPTGTPLTNDVLINEYVFDAQVDPAVAVASNGTILTAFVDFSSHALVGSGLDLYGRTFTSAGAPLSSEFLITTVPFTNGDQRLPRVVVDGSNRFLVVWMSESVDGSGYGIVARRFDVNGAPISSEFPINVVTTGDQREPRVAMETDGDFVVSWEDWSTGVSRTKFRRFDAALQPRGGEVLVHSGAESTYLPELITSPDGSDVVLAYEMWNGSDLDVELRRFAATSGPQIYCSAKTNSLGCVPQISFSGSPSASSASPFAITASNVISNSPGLLIYGYASNFVPFQGGTLCVAGPHRLPVQMSGGGAGGPTCSGSLSYDFNALVSGGADPLLVPGTTVSAQYYYRDASDPAGFGSGLTNAIRFTICP